MKIDLLVAFSVTKEETVNDSLNIIQDILVDGEEVSLVYSHVRDKIWWLYLKTMLSKIFCKLQKFY